MSAFLKIDRCDVCHQETPWDWMPPIELAGKPLPGTGVWRSGLIEGRCAACEEAIERERQRQQRAHAAHDHLVRLLGGTKPYREFSFERFEVTGGNKTAFERAKYFQPAKDNLYLWGSGGVGKTHLAIAVARRRFLQGGTIALTTPSQLIRKLRMKPPEEEQQVIDGFVRAEVFVLDDLGIGAETAYTRQILQEILDRRDFEDRGGLVVTSRHSLASLARRMNDDTITSRLSGLCQAVEIKGIDCRPRYRSKPIGSP